MCILVLELYPLCLFVISTSILNPIVGGWWGVVLVVCLFFKHSHMSHIFLLSLMENVFFLFLKFLLVLLLSPSVLTMGIICTWDSGPLLSWARCCLSVGKWVGSTALSLLTSKQASSTIYLALAQRLTGFFHELIYLTNTHSKKLSQKRNSFTFFCCSSELSGLWEGPGSAGVGMKAQQKGSRTTQLQTRDGKMR